LCIRDSSLGCVITEFREIPHYFHNPLLTKSPTDKLDVSQIGGLLWFFNNHFYKNIKLYFFASLYFLAQVKTDKSGEHDKQVVCRARQGGGADKRRGFRHFWNVLRFWNFERFFEKRRNVVFFEDFLDFLQLVKTSESLAAVSFKRFKNNNLIN
jgi:hypothetical protein